MNGVDVMVVVADDVAVVIAVVDSVEVAVLVMVDVAVVVTVERWQPVNEPPNWYSSMALFNEATALHESVMSFTKPDPLQPKTSSPETRPRVNRDTIVLSEATAARQLPPGAWMTL